MLVIRSLASGDGFMNYEIVEDSNATFAAACGLFVALQKASSQRRRDQW